MSLFTMSNPWDMGHGTWDQERQSGSLDRVTRKPTLTCREDTSAKISACTETLVWLLVAALLLTRIRLFSTRLSSLVSTLSSPAEALPSPRSPQPWPLLPASSRTVNSLAPRSQRAINDQRSTINDQSSESVSAASFSVDFSGSTRLSASACRCRWRSFSMST